MTFRSTYDGSTHRLTPEGAVERAARARRRPADGARRLPAAAVAAPACVRSAVDRTAAWAARARRAFDEQVGDRRVAQLGIVQGGTDVDAAPRERAAHRRRRASTATRSVGCRWASTATRCSTRSTSRWPSCPPTSRATSWASATRSGSSRRSRAASTCSTACCRPRLGRHGTILTWAGRLNLRNARYASDDTPLDGRCACPVCARWSRGYLRHLLSVHEPTAPRLLTYHNVHWTLGLVDGAPCGDRGGSARRAPGRGGGCVGRCRTGRTPRVTSSVAHPSTRELHGTPHRAGRHVRPDVGALHPAEAAPGAGAPARSSRSSSVGDEVITGGGIYGTITELDGRRRPARGRLGRGAPRRACRSASPHRRRARRASGLGDDQAGDDEALAREGPQARHRAPRLHRRRGGRRARGDTRRRATRRSSASTCRAACPSCSRPRATRPTAPSTRRSRSSAPASTRSASPSPTSSPKATRSSSQLPGVKNQQRAPRHHRPDRRAAVPAGAPGGAFPPPDAAPEGSTAPTAPGATPPTEPAPTTTTTAPDDDDVARDALGRRARAEGELAAAPLGGDGTSTTTTAGRATTTTAAAPTTTTSSVPDLARTSSTSSARCPNRGRRPDDRGRTCPSSTTTATRAVLPARSVAADRRSALVRVGEARSERPVVRRADVQGGRAGIDSFNAIAAQCQPPSPTCPTGQLAIVLDGVVQSAPTIQAPAFERDQITITGQFTEREAKDLALVLRYGALPIQFEDPTVETVSAIARQGLAASRTDRRSDRARARRAVHAPLLPSARRWWWSSGSRCGARSTTRSISFLSESWASRSASRA